LHTKGFIALLILILVLIISIPTEWIKIWNNYSIKKKNVRITVPLNSIKKFEIEDTFGAPRGNNRKHEGVDIFASRGTKIFNVQEGVVLFIGKNILGGNVIKIFGEDNRIFYYAHLDSFADIKVGDKIDKGKVIGYVGNTGNAIFTSPHLHFEIMEIKWLLPLITKNINPYYELQKADNNNEKQKNGN